MTKKRLSLSTADVELHAWWGRRGNRDRQDSFSMVYVNRNVQWSRDNRIMLEPVEFCDSATSTVPQFDQHLLTTCLNYQPKADLAKSFTWVDQGGPGVIVLQVAIASASAANPGLR